MMHALPRPGPRWGNYPQRPAGHVTGRDTTAWSGLPHWLPVSWVPLWHRRWLRQVRARCDRLVALPVEVRLPEIDAALTQARQGLRRHGLAGDSLIDGMAAVGAVIDVTLGKKLHDTQWLAAAMLLNQCAVEMATGEGKTLAMATAAALAALAGVPVHVVTSNDYLAERDTHELGPLWQALGLQVGHIDPAHSPPQRRDIYTGHIVYATAKELAFDHLRDCLARPGSGHEQPVMRGLCLALLDEADSILLDEAVVPLIISAARAETPAHQAQRRAIWWQASQLAQHLDAQAHFERDSHGLGIRLTEAGKAKLATLMPKRQAVWRRPRLRHELVQLALSAQHALHKDQHYLLREGRIELLDTLTGRVAVGRVWSQGLQALIEIKEGCAASPPNDTLAQLTFQRFFQRYWRMGALSGTLVEASQEMRQVYGLRTRRLPTRLPSRRLTLPLKLFHDAESRWHAVAVRAAALRAVGRPVLIGTDTVSDSERLSWHLTKQGVPHTVLNARHDATEAAIVGQAGESGRITVATRMAGRGTDVHLDAAALAAGGLHVIDCQRNESRRMDRQLWGRAARQGQPGSVETWICATPNTTCDGRASPPQPGWPPKGNHPRWSALARWHQLSHRLFQWLQAHRQAALRRQLQEQDRQWAQQHQLARHPGQPPL